MTETAVQQIQISTVSKMEPVSTYVLQQKQVYIGTEVRIGVELMRRHGVQLTESLQMRSNLDRNKASMLFSRGGRKNKKWEI